MREVVGPFNDSDCKNCISILYTQSIDCNFEQSSEISIHSVPSNDLEPTNSALFVLYMNRYKAIQDDAIGC